MDQEKKFKQANLEPVKKLIAEKTKDGDLSDSDIEEIIEKTKDLYKDAPLTPIDINNIWLTAVKDVQEADEKQSKVPLLLRILGIIASLSWLVALPTIINAVEHLNEVIRAEIDQITMTTTIVVYSYVFISFVIIALSIFTGILMILNKRKWAGRVLYTSIGFNAAAIILIIILEGADDIFYFSCAYAIIQILISVYLQPKLYQERKLQRQLNDLDLEQRAKEGRLGIKVDQSKGYIELDFFNLFWIFVAGCIIGLIAEYVFHILFVWGFNPENWYDRAGLLFGPFSPIYGFGGLFMTLFLNRLHNMHPIPLFVCTTIIGGAFEYLVSWFLETAFGIEAWNYNGMFLSIGGGRTCLLFAAMFGVMGFVWIKWALPLFMKMINRVPWKWRYPITFAATVFMIINCVMTLQSIDCWSQRQEGKEPKTQIEQFYATNYDDEFMSKRFASMNFQKDKSSRSDLEDVK